MARLPRLLITPLRLRTAFRTIAPTLLLGAAVCVGLVLLSELVTGSFVFEGATTPGEQEHVSPYFGGVVGAITTTGLIVCWQLAALWRAPMIHRAP